jgi:hypothetical protein
MIIYQITLAIRKKIFIVFRFDNPKMEFIHEQNHQLK